MAARAALRLAALLKLALVVYAGGSRAFYRQGLEESPSPELTDLSTYAIPCPRPLARSVRLVLAMTVPQGADNRMQRAQRSRCRASMATSQVPVGAARPNWQNCSCPLDHFLPSAGWPLPLACYLRQMLSPL